MWRQGELVGARFVTAKQLRDGLRKAKPGAKLKARRQA
jgi:hypothetical protein